MNNFYYYGIDSLYITLVIPALIIAIFSQIKVKGSFSKYSKKACNISGADAARRVLELNGVHNVRIEQVSGKLTDHFNPTNNTIYLSEAVYSAKNIAAVGVACHEAGHAVQYAKGYFPIKIRSAILPVCNIGSQTAVPLVILGIILNLSFLSNLGIIFFILAVFFQLITLPVEFNASARALSSIKEHYILSNESDYKGARSVLSAAAMTYVAALLVSLTQLVRLIAIAGRRR